MRILFVSRCLAGPAPSGDRVILDNLTRGLAARGHHLDLLGFRLSPQEPNVDSEDGVFEHVEAIPERRRSSLDYLIRLLRLFPDSASRSWNPSMWRAIERRLQLRTYDIAHAFGGVQVYEFRRLLTAALPTVITPYESYSRSLERDYARAHALPSRLRIKLQLEAARIYEGRIYDGFERVILLTDGDAESLRRLAPLLPIAVIPNGVGEDFFRPPRLAPREPVLTFVGNLSYPPNREAARVLCQEILPRVRAEVSDVRALIVGPDPPRDLSSLAGPEVEMTGWVPDIRPYLGGSTCFVSPLQSGSGMRNKILEAMAMGIPVVATPISCEGIDITSEKDILLGRDVQELAAGAVRLIRDEALRRRIAAAGQELMRRRHTWDSVVGAYEELYEAVISEQAAG